MIYYFFKKIYNKTVLQRARAVDNQVNIFILKCLVFSFTCEVKIIYYIVFCGYMFACPGYVSGLSCMGTLYYSWSKVSLAHCFVLWCLLRNLFIIINVIFSGQILATTEHEEAIIYANIGKKFMKICTFVCVFFTFPTYF